MRNRILFLVKIIRNFFKKVVVKYLADTFQDFCIYTAFLENFVNMSAGTIDLFGKSSNAMTIFFKFLFDTIPYVHKSSITVAPGPSWVAVLKQRA